MRTATAIPALLAGAGQAMGQERDPLVRCHRTDPALLAPFEQADASARSCATTGGTGALLSIIAPRGPGRRDAPANEGAPMAPRDGAARVEEVVSAQTAIALLAVDVGAAMTARIGGGSGIDARTRRSGDRLAPGGVSLTVEAGEDGVLRGPSGCAKTALRDVPGGFAEPTSGARRVGAPAMAGAGAGAGAGARAGRHSPETSAQSEKFTDRTRNWSINLHLFAMKI
jgi:hypothetical protein